MSIDSLAKSAEMTILTLAPERWKSLIDEDDLQKVSFAWTDSAKCLPSIKLPSGAITIPKPGATLIWAAAYQYWVLYLEYLKDQNAGAEFFSLVSTLRRTKAQLTYFWALHHYEHPSQARFPDLPDPTDTDDEDVRVANELYLVALGWILHHEFAHLRCNHPPISAIEHQEEKQADLEATKWIFEACTDTAQRKKRALGMSVAILLLTAIGLKSGDFDDRTHPKAFVRLDYCLEAAGLDDDHIAFAFSTLMMRVHLTSAGIGLPSSDGAQSHREVFSDHLYAVSQANKG
jgi:Peptidase U49